MRFETVSRTHVGLKRKINEDNLLVRSAAGLFVVADGMGGHEAGEVASARIVEALGALARVTPDEISACLGHVNRGLRDLAEEGGEKRTIGSTVVGLLIDEAQALCFWAGDSRAYRYRDSQLVPLSRDHSLVNELIEAGMIEAERADEHPNGNVITRAVGASDTLRLDIEAGEVRPGDVYLLASDGVTRMVPDPELRAALGGAQSLHEVADGLVWSVLQRGAPDNLTLVLIRVA
ncbi:protein phosphatase 2C domain-containing protein [Sphingomonas swuensis]|uniref:Protein phosphatase 2C domain-containing protein n=1 Tax=Sphingomonas swuensis TaxID=977800 RepID=A0ABP7SWT2_9SPHN